MDQFVQVKSVLSLERRFPNNFLYTLLDCAWECLLTTTRASLYFVGVWWLCSWRAANTYTFPRSLLRPPPRVWYTGHRGRPNEEAGRNNVHCRRSAAAGPAYPIPAPAETITTIQTPWRMAKMFMARRREVTTC